jgi:hypothetical protein
VQWTVTALLDGAVGLAAGLALIPVVDRVLAPLAALFPEWQGGGAAG